MPISTHSKEWKGTSPQEETGRISESQGDKNKVSATEKSEPRVKVSWNKQRA